MANISLDMLKEILIRIAALSLCSVYATFAILSNFKILTTSTIIPLATIVLLPIGLTSNEKVAKLIRLILMVGILTSLGDMFAMYAGLSDTMKINVGLILSIFPWHTIFAVALMAYTLIRIHKMQPNKTL